MLAILLTSALVAAQVTPADVGGGFARDAISSGPAGGSIIFQLFVSPSGVVGGCDVVYTNWAPASADRACGRLIGKRVSQVAKRADGTPVHGTVLFSMIARSGDRASPSLPFKRFADLTVTVQDLPSDLGTNVSVETLVLVDHEGLIQDCSPAEEEVAANASLISVACDQLKQVRPPVRHDADGNPVPYVTDLSVEFVTEAATQS